MRLFLAIILTFVFIMIIPYRGNSQIINIEGRRIVTDTTGWSGTAGVSLAATKFVKSYFAFSVNSHVQYKTQKDLFLIILDYDVINAGGESFTNTGYGHLRYNREVSEVIRLEVFSQLQYNSLTKIDARYLTGGGLRLKLSPYENAKFYFGLTYMYEYENLVNPEIKNRDHRASSYFTFTLLPVPQVRFSSTTYAQPRIGMIKDYRISNDTRLTFKVTESLQFLTSIHFLYDSRPPIEVPGLNYQISNGLTYKF